MATTKSFEGNRHSATQGRARLRRSATALPILLLLACSGGQTGDEFSEGNGITREIRGNATRLEAVEPADGTASSDLNEFAWRFLALESETDQNTVFSPVSISIAAAMLSAGAQGETLTEIQQALGFSTEGAAFHAARNSLLQALEDRNREGTETANTQALRLSDDFWVDNVRCAPTDLFLDTLSANYGVGVQLTDFVSDPEAARQAINAKVAEDTETLIDELLPPNSIDADTVFVLSQAIYFGARWAEAFPLDATEPAPFETNSGQSVTVPMMFNPTASASYVETDAYAAVALKYEQEELEFVAIMPAAGTFEEFVAGLPATGVAPIIEQLTPAHVELRMPKFETTRSVPLKARLKALGVERAFNSTAELGAICVDSVLGDAFHDATISLDEEGTVAAAATAFVEVLEIAPVAETALTFDHPFIYLIRDIQTDATLFVGQFVTDQ